MEEDWPAFRRRPLTLARTDCCENLRETRNGWTWVCSLADGLVMILFKPKPMHVFSTALSRGVTLSPTSRFIRGISPGKGDIFLPLNLSVRGRQRSFQRVAAALLLLSRDGQPTHFSESLLRHSSSDKWVEFAAIERRKPAKANQIV